MRLRILSKSRSGFGSKFAPQVQIRARSALKSSRGNAKAFYPNRVKKALFNFLKMRKNEFHK